MSASIRHTMLVANAGSGKTYALTTRMVKLLAFGVEPRKIAALTFTKKAAGEFLDAVFLRLAEAALDPEKLRELNKELNSVPEEGVLPALDAARCRELLARLVADSGRLTMGTIDGLFARIARSFPLESGLPGEFSMIGESELERARTEALAAIFRHSSHGSEFLDQVRRIARRQGEREVFRTLLDSARDFHGKYLENTKLPWGDRDLIWKSTGCEILAAGEVKPAADALWAEILKEHPGLSQEAREKWAANLDAASDHKPGSFWSKGLKEFIRGRLCKCSVEMGTGEEYLPTGRSAAGRVYLRGTIPELRRQLLLALLKPVYESLLGKSASLRDFMRTFEDSYHVLTRRRGRMTFSDVTDLLCAQVGSLDWMTSAGYRLDAKLDHWLLDEFQDTSRVQWKVLGSFIDEMIQDSGGERSLFYVGDTKQAIYSWRGGDPELFFEIFNHYNKGSEKRVVDRDLKVSYRSAKEIVDIINKVFGAIWDHAGALGIPPKTLASWKEAWREHFLAEKNKDLEGYFRWDAVEAEEGEENPVHRRIAEILEEVQPWRRKLGCGVLTRKNEEASSIAAILQARVIPVSVEGKSNPCNDNPLGLALLAAFRVAAFPEDTLSLGLLRSSPLAVFLKEGVESFRTTTLTVIAQSGYEAAVRSWTEGLDLNPFLSRRAADFLSAAAEYDTSNRGSVSDFVSFLEGHAVQESEASGVVRVMTLHQSKGLTFDMSVVCGLDGRGGNSTDILHLGGGEPPEWGYLLPSKDDADPDPVMRVAREEIVAKEEYGKLCAAYVAMTRSKQALYVLTKKLKTDTTARNFARQLMLTLNPGSDVVESGNQNWFEKHGFRDEMAGKKASEERRLVPCTAGTPHALSPSSLHGSPFQGSSSTHQERGSFSLDAADLGTEIHEVLSRIAWDAAGTDLSGCTERARRMIGAFLRSEGAGRLFNQPEGAGDLWRERRFDLVMEGQWISGCFDRVVIRRNGDHVTAVDLIDFKTDSCAPEHLPERHAGQMASYRTVLSRLLGIEESLITPLLVHVRSGTVVPVRGT